MKKLLALLVSVLLTCSIAIAGCTTETETTRDPVEVEKDTKVTVRLNVGVEDFGELVDWEASLYMGAIAGEETSGRFTEWKPVDDAMEILFLIPEDVREGNSAPMGKLNDCYVRVRDLGDINFPKMDVVSNPFTLTNGKHHQVHIWLDSEAVLFEDEDLYEDNANVLIVLFTGINDFGETGEWEASLYMGAIAGEETSGRFTEWKPVDVSGGVEFDVLSEALNQDEIPWDVPMDTYLRIRTIGDDAYPQYDLVTAPFTLSRGGLHMVPARLKTTFD